jgi:hypothetical protein
MAATGAPAGTPIVNQNAGLTPQMGIVNGDGTPTVFFFRWLLNTRSGAGKQTPWLSDIDAAGFNLDNLGNLTLSGSITFPDGTVQTTAPAALVPATRTVLGGVKIGANVTIAADGTISVAAPGGSQTPWTQNINAAGFQLQNAGNVGIGTSAPASQLTVIPASVTSGVAAANQIAIGLYTNTVGDRMLLGYSSVGGNLSGIVQVLSSGTPSPLVLNPSGGRVGIGNTAPAYPLDVAGDVNTSGAFRVNGVALAQTPWTQNINAAGFQLQNAGAVGIGTAAPGVKLDVVSNDNTDSGGALRLYALNLSQNATHSFGGITSTYYYKIQTNIAQYIALQPAGGNVGIGTTTPAGPLHIFGSDVQFTIQGSSATKTAVFALNTNAGDPTMGGLIIQRRTPAGGFEANLITVNLANGNVGIGTLTPAYALDAAGDVNVTGTVRVKGIPLAVAPRYYFASQGGAANAITVTSPDGQQPPPGSMISVLLTNNTINANQTNTIAFNGGTPHSIISSRSVTNLAVGYALNCVFTGILDTNNGYVRDISQ